MADLVHGTWSIEMRHIKWPWTTPNPYFKVRPFFDTEYLRNGHSYYGRRTGNRTQAFKWYHFQWHRVSSNRHFTETIIFNIIFQDFKSRCKTDTIIFVVGCATLSEIFVQRQVEIWRLFYSVGFISRGSWRIPKFVLKSVYCRLVNLRNCCYDISRWLSLCKFQRLFRKNMATFLLRWFHFRWQF